MYRQSRKQNEISNEKIKAKLRNFRENSKFMGWGRVEGFVAAQTFSVAAI